MIYFILFVFGLVIGSFFNVVALRYDGEHSLFDPKVIGGRSHCPQCKKTLQWYELIPLVSFIIQGARCRNCGKKIGWQYPIVELISGFIFILVPLRMASLYGGGQGSHVLSAFWILAFEIIFLISYVDIRLKIVPDELTIALGVVGIFLAISSVGYFGLGNESFLGAYSLLFGLQSNFWAAHVLGAIFGAGFFYILVLVTRGKGMGMGDVKLAVPLGFLFGWPDMVVLYVAAFVIGSLAGVLSIMMKKKTMKGALPFVPFLAAGAAFVFFFGFSFIGWYFHLVGI